MSEMRIMVLGAGGPAADNYIKSLRLADPSIYVLGVDTHALMLELSCATETVCIDTRPGFKRHLEALDELVYEHGITMIHAQPDQETYNLSLMSEQLPVSVPHAAMVRCCQNKLTCAIMLGDLAPASQAYEGWFPGPSWMRARRGAGSLAAKLVEQPSDMHAWEAVWDGRVAPSDFMLSEYLPGEDRSYTGVWWRGEPVASACRVRVEYADTRTPSGQCSSPRIAKLDSRPETFDVAEKAIRRVSDATGTIPHGVFYVDMRESEDGRLLVTEINAGRFNTTQNFYAEAGLNLPFVHAMMHHGMLTRDEHWTTMQRDGKGSRITRLSNNLCLGRLQREDDLYWVRQPDMGHKLVTKTRVTA